ncbi:MAG: potassium channel family protein [Gammaproteobacteria bacterium]|nr:potassium channel family protein [Gammaproteobacteria bacterium]
MYEFLAILISLIIACVATWIHLKVITASSRIKNVYILTLIILLAHIAEIQVYAWSYNLISLVPGMGCIVDTTGECVNTWFDLTYYSAAVYTTLGFGDLVPIGPMRILTGIESVVGLALIAWSATFTFMRLSTLEKPETD